MANVILRAAALALLVGLDTARADAAAERGHCAAGLCVERTFAEGFALQTEDEVEGLEAGEAEALDVSLLQTKIEKSELAAGEGALAEVASSHGAGAASVAKPEEVSALEVDRPHAASSIAASAVASVVHTGSQDPEPGQPAGANVAPGGAPVPSEGAAANVAPGVVPAGAPAPGQSAGASAGATAAMPKKVTAAAHNKESETMEILEGVIPGAAIVLGFFLVRATECRTAGLLSIYFGVQTGLNIYMKVVLSGAVISQERGMKGIPAAFMVTALQQLVSFALLVPTLVLLWFTPWRYTPKPLTSRRAVLGVLGLSTTFALNIGLNNLCLSLLPMSINLMIRSCIPLATWLMQSFVSMILPNWITVDGSKSLELALMLLGVLFAGLASIAKEEGAGKSEEASNMGVGLFVGVLSLVACSLYLIFAQWLGKDVKLNPVDMTLYMSVPAAAFLAPLIMLLPHPIAWHGAGSMTDWEVFSEVYRLSPSAVRLAMLSGVFAVMYNTLQYAMVSELSATHTAFAGNFNKAATIVMSLALGMETLPGKPWGEITVFSIAGGIASFTAYSVIKATSGGKAH